MSEGREGKYDLFLSMLADSYSLKGVELVRDACSLSVQNVVSLCARARGYGLPFREGGRFRPSGQRGVGSQAHKVGLNVGTRVGCGGWEKGFMTAVERHGRALRRGRRGVRKRLHESHGEIRFDPASKWCTGGAGRKIGMSGGS